MLKYRIEITHVLDGKLTSSYDAHAIGTANKYENGYYEEFQWVSVKDNGKQVDLSLEAKKIR